MDRVVNALPSGKVVLVVSGSLLRNAEVQLELTRRPALPSVALSGSPVAPVQALSAKSIARAVGVDGVLVLVEPDNADTAGLNELAKLLAGQRTLIVVAAQKPNLFALQMQFRGFPIEHLKTRGEAFLKALPIPEAVAVAASDAPKSDAKPATEAPPEVFVGRDEELATLKGMLAEGGPIVVSGGAGIGKLTLVEHALEGSGLSRFPDVVLGRGAGFDTLIARLAVITEGAGQGGLAEVLKAAHTPAQAIEAAIAALSAAESLAGSALVVQHLHAAIGREGDLFRKGRLEMLAEALLTSTFPLRLIFTSRVQPVFYREGAGANLRRLPLSGIKGRFYYEIFQAYKAPEFPRDKVGPLTERLHGNPLAVRTFAIAMRQRQDGLKLLDDAKFMALDSDADHEGIEKALSKQLEKVTGDVREALARLAHLRQPIPGAFFGELKVNKKLRAQLLADGLLEMVPGEPRRFSVHPSVKRALPLRDVNDFDINGKLGEIFAGAAKSATGLDALVNAQESNRCFIAAHRFRDVATLQYPDQDALREAVIGLLRSQRPNPALAKQRIADMLKVDPSNDEAWLLKAELAQKEGAADAEIAQIWAEAAAAAPVPEIFHQATSWWLGRKHGVSKAIALLEAAVVALPNEPRLRTRLAVLLLRDGRRPGALEQLRAAMELAPMLPDAYGILGMAKRDEGEAAEPEAEALLREAVRLNPGDAVQGHRLADLLLARARLAEPAEAAAIWEEAKALLDPHVSGDRANPECQLLLAALIRESGGDLERAVWLVKQAKKSAERNPARHTKASVEFALLDLARNNLDQAESTLRGLMKKEQGDPRVFAALAAVLEGRGLLIPAHAELKRAAERARAFTAEQRLYARGLERLVALIEAGATVIRPDSELDSIIPTGPVADTTRKVVRRKKGSASEESGAVATDDASEAQEAAGAEDGAGESDGADEGGEDGEVSGPIGGESSIEV